MNDEERKQLKENLYEQAKIKYPHLDDWVIQSLVNVYVNEYIQDMETVNELISDIKV